MTAELIDRLAALSVEAQRRGITYGELMASTSRWERDEIWRRVNEEEAAKKKRGGGRGRRL